MSFISSEPEQELLDKVERSFVVNIPELPDKIDISRYMATLRCSMKKPIFTLHTNKR